MSQHVKGRVRRLAALVLTTRARLRRRRALARIEREIGQRDPHLREMFAIFASLNRGERPTGPEPLPSSRRPSVALALVLPLLTAGLVIGLVGALAPRPASACPARPHLGSAAPRSGSQPAPAPASGSVSCP